MTMLAILSGGAAQGLVKALEVEFADISGLEIDGVFGAVGAMRARLAAGHRTDVVILTSAILAALVFEGVVMPGPVDIGGVETAIAVREGDELPHVGDDASLRAALLSADAVYCPDTEQSTAGIHVANVVAGLGITEELRGRLKTFPNGATAMRALAQAPEARVIGCTQATEILATPGARLVASLPPGRDLTTVYTAGIVAASSNREAAQALLDLLVAGRHGPLRARCGLVAAS